MKKIIFITALASFFIVNLSFAADKFDTNFKTTFEKNFEKKDMKISKIISKDKLNFTNNLNLVVVQMQNSDDVVAFLSSNDGKSILSYPQNAVFSNEHDRKLIDKKLTSAKTQQEAAQNKVALEILKTIPEDRFIEIESFYKDNKNLIYMVTDPECPYCRDDMSKMVKWLRNGHVKIIFAPVHGKSAYTKAAIISREARKLKSDNQEAIVKILEKYYDKNTIVSDSDATDAERSLIFEDAKKLFSKGVIKGVPFKVETQK